MRTLYEGARGCGYRKGGGLYLVSGGVGQDCPLLPVAMTVCSCCGQGIKPARGFTWVDPDSLLPHHSDPPTFLKPNGHASPHAGCPLNQPGLMGERAGLLWIGEKFYPTPQDWIDEGYRMGFSRRISQLPRGFEAGDTWVLVGHRKAIRQGFITEDGAVFESLHEAMASTRNGSGVVKDRYVPAIFHLWLPERVEYVVTGEETTEELVRLEKRGIEPVRVIPIYETIEGAVA